MTHLGKFRSVEAMLEATPDLGSYKGDFYKHNEKIYPTDLDAIVEVKGEFLVHEYKKVGAPENQAQQILLEALREKKGFATIDIWHVGPCWDMNFVKATFTTPSYMPMNAGESSVTLDTQVLAAIRRFHNWWTKQILIKNKGE